jgi:hypothetical protein
MISVDNIFWCFACTKNQQRGINCEKSACEKSVGSVSREGKVQTQKMVYRN